LILFPHRANVLCCGLAGILTIKKADQKETTDPKVHLAALFEKVTQQDMKRIRDGAIPSERYLNGPNALFDLEQCILTLKGDDSFKRLFFDPQGAATLTDLSKKMNVFLVEEQTGLESQAAHFSTRDLEVINSRLTRMKDFQPCRF
jgi:glucosamine--fructose-6-phosphate aminotransferase (isomerizing)